MSRPGRLGGLLASLALGLVLALAAGDASAQRAFSTRFTTNTNGDISLIGNMNMTCPAAAGNCAAAQAGGNFSDNDFAMVDVDVDLDAGTFNSSTADLSMPGGSTVLFAGLYWGAKSTDAARGQVLFQRPGGFGYQVVAASQVDTTGSVQYGAFADVTAIVQAGGNGTYAVANIQRTTGTNMWAGWALVVVYGNTGSTLKNLTVFDGFQLDPASMTVSGFLTPLSGPVSTRLGFVGWDGDLDSTSAGETFTINGVQITDAQNPAANFFNSTISDLGSPVSSRNPNYVNTLGLDIDRVNAPAGAVGNGATSATIAVGNATEEIWIQAITFATELYVPIITPNVVKTAVDVNGGSLNRGDVLRYTVSLSNTGLDTATGVVLTDNIPANTTYVPGSLVVVSGANAGAKTDGSGDDQAEYIAAGTPRVVFRLGNGANAVSGGTIANGQSTAIQFDVTIDATTPAGTQISNSAQIAYSGQTLGATFSTSSAITNATVLGPPTITKSWAPNAIPNGGTSVLTIEVGNPASNPGALTGVSFSDTYPANLLNTPAPNPQIICTAGSTAGTVNAAAGGNSVSLSPGATILPGGRCTVTVNVTSSVDGLYNNVTSVVSSTNGGSGTTGGTALLSVGKPPITKAIAPATILSGGTATVTLTITNSTAGVLTGVAFSDPLTNMTVAAAPNATNTCGGTLSAPALGAAVSLSGGTIAASGSCTITFDVTSAVAGVHSNTTSGVSSNETGSAGNPSNTVTLTVIGAPVITKSFSPTSVAPNTPSLMTITVSNPNPTTTLTSVAFTDTYPDPDGGGASQQMLNDTPANRTFNCTAGSTGTVTGGVDNGTTVGLSAGSLAPGGSCTITVNVESAAIAGGSQNYLNSTGTVSSANGGTGAAASATLNVTTLTAPTVTKAFAPANIAVGGTSVMTITLTNPNGSAVTGVAFTDAYPAGLVNTGTPAGATTCPAGTVTAVAGGNSLAFSGGTINAGSNCTVTVNVTSPAAGARFNNTGTITTANAGTRAGASATLTALLPPTITKSFSPSSVALNGDSTLTFVLSNPNPVALTGVGFTDIFPAGAIVTRNAPAETNSCGGTWQDSGGGGINDNDPGVRLNNNGTIPANGTCTLTVTTRGIAVGTHLNTSGAVTATGPIALTGNTASATLAVGQLGIAKAFSASPVAPGANVTLTFTISNSTGGARTGLGFTDTYPSGLVNSTPLTVGGTCTGVTHTATAGGGTFNVTSGNVPVGGCTITVLVTSATPGSYANQASGVTHSTDPTPGSPSNVATLVVRQPPTVTKSFAPATITPGQASTLTITINNANGDTMTGVAFTDAFPANLVVAATPAATNTCGGAFQDSGGGAIGANDVGVSLTGGSIGANTTCTLTVNVTSATAGSYANSTGAVTTTNAGTGTAANATLVVMAAPTVAKAFAPSTIGLNGTSTLTVTLTNPNATTAITGVDFTDTYPAGLANAATPGAGGTCGGTVTAAAGGSTLQLAGGTIPAGGNCTVSVTVTGTTTGAKLNNTGPVATANAGTGTTASATLTVLDLLTVAKSFTPATVGVGQASVLTVTLTNPNATPVTGVALADIYPAGLVNTGAANGATTCGGTPTVTAANGGNTVALSGATVPASGSCQVTVNVTSASPGSYLNSTGAVSTANAGTAAAASATLTVAQASLTKAFSPASVTVGGTSTLVFTLANGAGNPAQAGINFTDTLPAGLVIAATPNVQSNCPAGGALVAGPAFVTAAAGGSVITTTGAAMSAAVASCEIRVDVTPAAAPTTTACPVAANTNGAASVSGLANLTNGVTDQCLTVNAATPALTKAFTPATLTVGGTTTLTFTVTQPAGNPTQTFSFTDTLPAGLVVGSGAVGGTCAGGTVTATAGTNTITVASRQVTGTSCTITVPITTSATPSTAACPVAANTNGAAQISGITNLTNSVTDQCVTVSAATPALTKAFTPATLTVGGTTTLTFTVTQPAGNPTQTFSFTDTLPAGLVVGSGAVGGTCSGGTVTATAGTNTITVAGRQVVNPATSCTITIPITTSATPSTAACPVAANTNGAAQISGTTNLSNSVTDQCVTVSAATPALTKAFTPATLTVGGTTTLTFTVTQPAGNPTQTFSFTDTLPAGLVVGSGAVGGTCSGGTVTATAGTNSIAVAGQQIVNPATSCTITVPITTSATPSTAACPVAANTNGAAQISGTTNLTNSVTDQCVTVSAATPALAKAFTPATLTVGGTTTLTFTVTQPAGNPTQTFSFTDTLPAGLVVGSGAVGGTCAGGTVTATAGTNTITVASRQVTGTSCTITVPITTSATPSTAACPVAANTNGAAQISGTTNLTNSVTDQCVSVSAATPALTKAFTPATLTVGGTTTLTFTVTQPAGNPTQTFSFTDTLPAGLVVGSGAVGGTCSGGTVTATAGTNTITVASRQVTGTSCTITVPITTSATPSTAACPVAANTNGAAQISGITNLTNSVTDQCVAVSAATPALTKAFTPATLTVGGTTTLTFTVTQPAGNPTQTFSFTDTLPAGLVVGSGAVGGTCSGGTVTATAGTNTITVASRQVTGTSCTITVPITTSATPSTAACPVAANTNGTAQISGITNLTNSVTDQCVTVSAATPALTKAFTPATLTVGGTTTLTFTVTQPAGNPTQTFSFTDTLPAGLVVGSGAVGGTCAGGTVTATAGTNTITVASRQVTGTSCTITVPITTSATPSTAACPVAANTNGTAQISGITNLTNSVTDQCVTVSAATPALTKAFTPATLTVGGTTTLTFTVTQPVGNPTQTFSFTDTLPAGLVVGSGAVGGTCAGGTVTATAGTNTITVASRQVVNPATSCTITVPITTSATPSTAACPVAANTNGAAQISGITNLTNSVTDQCVTVSAATPALTKAFTPATLTVGGTTTLTFTVTQPAGNPTQTFSFTDTLPAGLVVGSGAVGGTCAGGTVTATAGTNTITVASRQVTGTSCTITVPITTSATPSTAACPVVANTNGAAQISGTTNLTNSVTDQCVTVSAATPALTKAFTPATLTVGGTTTLTFTVSQPAGNPTQTFSFTDTLPAGLVVGSGAVGGTCAGGTVTATAGTNTITAAGRQVTGTSCTITVPITTSATPSTAACPVAANTNGAAQISGITNLTNSVTDQCVTVSPAVPSLAKSFTPAALTVGGTTTLTFTVTQPAGNPTQTFSFTDTLPAGLVVGSGAVGGTCTGGTVTATAGTNTITVAGRQVVNPATSCTITVPITTSATPSTAACPVAANTNGAAQISGTTNLANGVTDQCVTVTAATPTLDKAFSGALTVGGTTTLTFTVSQPAGNPTQTFSFTDTLPAGLVVGSGAVGGTCSGGTVTATAGTNTITVASRQVTGTSCTITVPITSSATPTVGTCPQAGNTNGSAQISGTTNIAAAISNSAAGGGTSATGACVTVNAATPALTKAFTPATLTVGGTTTLTFTVTQPAGNPTQTFSFTDTLPAGLVVGSGAVGGTCAGGTVTATAGTNTITVASRQVTGTSCTITVPITTSATPSAAACPVAANTNGAAQISGITNLTNSVTDQCVTVSAATPALTKAFTPATLTVGGTTTLTFTVTQPAGNPTQTFSFTDTLPAGLVVGSGAVGGTCTGGTVTATAGTNTITVAGRQVVNPATSCTITVPITTSATPSTAACPVAANTNGAAQISGTTNLANGVTDQCVTVTAATPTLDKAFSGALTVGGTTTLTFTVSQPAGNPTQTFSFTDTLPAGLVVGSGAVGGTCSGGTVTATAGTNTITVASRQVTGTSCTITVPITSSATPTVGTCPQAGNTNGSAQISGTTNIAAAISNSAAGGGTSATGACVTVNAATPALTKAFTPATLTVGGTTTLTFTVTQPAGNPTQTFSFTDTLPAGLVVGSGAVGGTCAGGTVTATAGTNTITVASRQVTGTSCTITVPITTSATPSTAACPVAANTNGAAQISGTTNLTNSVTDQCVSVSAATPALTKAFTPATLTVGGTTTLTFTVTQPAGNPTQTFSFTDTLPAGLVVGSGAVGGTCSGGTVTATAGTNTITVAGRQVVNPATSCTITVPITTSATPSTAACPVAANTNGAAQISGTTNLTNSITDQCVAVSAATPALTKAFTPATLTVGGTTTLTFTVTQPAGNPTQTFSFTDTLPAGLVVGTGAVGGTCSGGTVTATAGTNTITVASRQVTGTSCTITVPITTSASPSTAACPVVANTNGAAQISGTTNLTNGVTDQCVTVSSATPALTKAFTPATLTVGGTTTLTFTVTQPAGNPTQTFSFTDTLPAGLVVGSGAVGGTCSGGTVTATAGTNTITVASRQVTGTSCTITVPITTSATPSTAACPVAANTNGAAQISGTTNLSNGVTDQCVTVSAATPVLTKAFGAASIALGGTTTLTFTVTQPAGNPTQTFSFTDTLPAGLAVGSGAVGGTCSGGTVTATAGTSTITVAGRQVTGASCTIAVPVTTSATPAVGACPLAANTNGAAQISGIANLTNSVTDQCLGVTASAPTIAKAFAPATIASGGVSTLTVTITNPNAAAIAVTGVTDTFPATPGTGLVRAATPNASTTCAGGAVGSTAGSVTLTGGTVPASGSCTFQIDVTAATAGSYINTIAAGALTTNAGSNAAPASATLTVTPVANVAVAKSGPATVANGAPVAYTIVVSNAGPDAANGATFSDTVPAAVTGVSASCGSPTGGAACGAVNVAGNAVTSTVTTLPSGGTVTITINGTAPGTGSFTNTATVAPPAGTTDPVAANNSSSVTTTVQRPDLSIAKTHAGSFTVGANGTYTITVSNAAGTLATSGTITVVDTLPAGLAFVSASGAGWSCASAPPTVTCTSSAAIPAGGTGAAITLTVSVASPAVPAVTNSATVSGGSEPAALNGDNTAADYTIVNAAPVNTFQPDGAQTGLPGTTVFYPHTFTAGSAGSVGFSTSAIATPAVPGWTQVIYRDTNCNGVLDGAEGAAPLAGTVAVAAGASVCIVVADNIPAAAPYNAQKVITVTSTFNGTQTIARTDTTTVGAVGGAGLTLAKSVRNVTQGGAAGTANTARPNDDLEYTVTYANAGSGPLSTIVVTDSTPAFTLFQSATCGAPLPASLTACAVTTQPAANGTGSIVWTLTGSLLPGGSGTVVFVVRVSN